MRFLPADPDDARPHVEVRRPAYEGLLSWIRTLLTPPLSGNTLLVRGVLPPPPGRVDPRVVLWDGHDLTSSAAFDIAVTDTDGAPFPPLAHIPALRSLASEYLSGQFGAPTATDPFGIPIHDARQRYRAIMDEGQLTISDALAVPLNALTTQVYDVQDCALWGFFLLDEATGRYYARVPGDREGTDIMVGIDLRLCDAAGRPTDQVGLLDVYLPSLAYDRDLTRFHVADSDGYCDMICDLTLFISGRQD
jgi:hypothetical protein